MNFRDNEFVSILGHSGSGKTTLLNIIGGLDRYTSGDLVINGVSTKKYSDSDWDIYRNNKIGFIFQSYNLIPHQTVLANVEMSLTLSGVSKSQRKARAVEALKKVGLGDHINKKPNQMSGGQMQRVAIARALVNNPDILLADEPTGALDSETSIQIMDLLKEIAKDKLVIMVTHNPELAEQYSTRIVRLMDGNIVSDSNPYNDCDAPAKPKKQKKVSMSFFTALSLSFNNLRTKKGRTVLTAFAGSIGIIGIALILALSTGMNDYIANVQKDTMSAYPINISSQALDSSFFSGLREQWANRNKEEEPNEGIYIDYKESGMSGAMVSNNLAEFKKYLDDPNSDIGSFVGENGIIYSYNTAFNVYAFDVSGEFIDTDTEIAESSPLGFSFSGGSGFMSKFRQGLNGSSGAANFSEMMSGANGETISQVITDSYELVSGEWPKTYDEVVLVLDKNRSLSSKTLYQLGFITKERYDELTEKGKSDENTEAIVFNFSDVINHSFYLIAACDMYAKNDNGIFTLIDDIDLNKDNLLENATELKIMGIVCPTANTTTAAISTAVGYTSLLTNYIIDHTSKSEVIAAQKSAQDINVLSGQRFDLATDEEKISAIKDYLKNADEAQKAAAYRLTMLYSAQNNSESKEIDTGSTSAQPVNTSYSKPSVQPLGMTESKAVPTNTAFTGTNGNVKIQNVGLFDTLTSVVGGLVEGAVDIIGKLIPQVEGNQFDMSAIDDETMSKIIDKWLENNGGQFDMSAIDDEMMAKIIDKMLENSDGQFDMSAIDDEMMSKIIDKMLENSDSKFDMSALTGDEAMAKMLDKWLNEEPDRQTLLKLYDQYIGSTSYEDNLNSFGDVNFASPSSISIYVDDFESKEAITKRIEEYNEKADENNRIAYTDYVAKMTSSLTGIINGISYVLIAFVAVSLIVSCIMIGIITHISVMERTKEIGILRALGASKSNISQVFNAETFIIGCCSGLIGIGASMLLTVPINKIISLIAQSGQMSSLSRMSAALPLSSAIVLIVMSIVITVLGGLLPAKKAAKKDPVIALRTE